MKTILGKDTAIASLNVLYVFVPSGATCVSYDAWKCASFAFAARKYHRKNVF